MEAAFVFIAIFAGAFGIIYYFLQSRHRERMALIEKGADAKLFQTEPRKRNYFFAMLLGVLFVCISLGIAFGFAIDEWMFSYGRYRGDNPGPYFMMIFLFIGIGFITSYFLHKRLNNKD